MHRHASTASASRRAAEPGSAPEGVLQRRCSCGSTPGPTGECAECRRKRRLGLQPRLRLSRPGDRFEREADRTADRVMRSPRGAGAPARALRSLPLAPGPGPLDGLPLARWQDPSEPAFEEEAADLTAENLLSKKDSPGAGGEVPPGVHQELHAMRGGGRRLDPALRSFFEPRFGYDFDRVRVHTDGRAASSARALGARAYTLGAHIVFGADEFAPRTGRGRHLLAHELAHVVQQRGSGPGSGRRTIRRRRINYIEQLSAEDCAPHLASYDESVQQIERQLQGVTGPAAEDLTDALARMRALRQGGRVTCWRISGGRFYASYDNATDQLRLHVNVGAAARSPTTLIHEAIHAVHGERYPRLRRLYAQVLEAGGTTNESLGILLLKWKAWTEYWAYRRQVEYANLRQRPEHRRDAHRSAMERRDVRGSIARVRAQTGDDFRPWEWQPPARYRARSGRRSRSPGQERAPTPQPKLKVNSPGDRWEREADRIADKIVGAAGGHG